MFTTTLKRKSLVSAPILFGLALLVPAQPARAVSKEIIQLQTQVQSLQDMLNQMQRSNSEQLGVLQHLIEQSSDNVNKMTQQMTALGAKVDAESQNTQLSGQIQSLNDSVDELKTRLAKIDTALSGMQSQMQNVSAGPAGAAQPPPPSMPQQQPDTNNGGSPQAAPGTNVPLNGAPNGGAGAPGPQAAAQGATAGAAQAPPVDELYQSAVRDYDSAKYDLATSEFADVVKYYPQTSQAGNASFYLGEVAYRQGLYPAAIRNYNIVLEQFAGSAKAPAAQLRKGEAELASSQREAGIQDLRALVQRYPTSPEGAQGRSLLNGMGVRLSANKPSPYQQQ